MLTAGVLAVACAETKRTQGEECLKSDDCISGICRSLVCTSEPPNEGPIDAAPSRDTSTPTDADAEAADSNVADAPNDGG